jgi:hypothetical protein
MISLINVKNKINYLTLENKMKARLLTSDEVRDKLIDRRLSYVADKCGLTYMSLSRIRKNEGNPSLANKTLRCERTRDSAQGLSLVCTSSKPQLHSVIHKDF